MVMYKYNYVVIRNQLFGRWFVEVLSESLLEKMSDFKFLSSGCLINFPKLRSVIVSGFQTTCYN